MFYYQHHIGDFIRDTSRLNDGQCMAYLRLLWIYYETESPIQNNPEKIAFQIGASVTDVSLILDHFFNLDGDFYRHTRCDKVIEEYQNHKETSSLGGKKSAESRRKKRENLNTTSTPLEVDLKNNQHPLNTTSTPLEENASNHKPITNNHKPVNKKTATGVARPDSVSQQVWDDWMIVRKDKRAKTLTETSWKQIVNHAEKAGWTLEQAISHCCLKQWVGFEADWVNKKQSGGGYQHVNKQEALEASNRSVVERFLMKDITNAE